MTSKPSRSATGGKSELRVGRRKVPVSNLKKVFYPATGHTKGDVIHYYSRIGPLMLPHLRDRPVTLKRYPDGVKGFHFYEKNCASHRPPWIATTEVARSKGGKATQYCLLQDMPSLIWAANLASIEFHSSLFRSGVPDRPTVMVFDLDPGPGCDLSTCAEVGLELRASLEVLKLKSFPKTSGSKGLQLYVPLNTAGVNFDETGAAARTIAGAIEDQRPDLVVTNMRKTLRKNRVLIDWSQNNQHKTTVCVYSLRAREAPTPSAPLLWKEVERVAKDGDVERLRFDFEAVLKRAEKHGDLFEPVVKLRQKLVG